MKCYTCKSKMKCYDDMNNVNYRADLFKCEKCKSEAYVEYGNNGEYIKKVEWKR